MTLSFVLVKTAPGKEKPVIIDLLRQGITKNISIVFGEFDIVLAVRTNDHQALGQMVIDRIRVIPGVEDTMTLAGCSLADIPSSIAVRKG
ncbi:MAG: Lrp/AsnC ligand binding domain-containing protein [Thermoplasmata archaeon]|nr:Lrp/AsnC ligand binding domain-containing protein [Thermoplasmata archaeon]MCK5413932.1 Lrp/AsnC ligand binding domain-containing protein [Thermoplasmata archaeon]